MAALKRCKTKKDHKPTDDTVAVEDLANADYFLKLSEAVSCVLQHPLFEGLRSTGALPYGSQAGYSGKKYQEEIVNGVYISTGVIAWINEMYNPLPGISFRYSACEDVMDHEFSKPTRHATPLLIACDTTEYNPMDHKGALKLVTPPEKLHVQWFAVLRSEKNT